MPVLADATISCVMPGAGFFEAMSSSTYFSALAIVAGTSVASFDHSASRTFAIPAFFAAAVVARAWARSRVAGASSTMAS